MDASIVASASLTVVFLGLLFRVAVSNPSMFLRRHGRSHRVLGLLLLLWLTLGLADVLATDALVNGFVFDVLLGVLGIATTLSAARAFDHRNVKNRASGALDDDATVTHAEMVEHAFYQVLNLVQIVYLHSLGFVTSSVWRAALCLAATTPWLARSRFPVNSFSANYVTSPAPWSRVAIMYRVKKWQYLLYKHALLHGLNVTAAVALGDLALPRWPGFRLYWVLLNLAYVSEFFLQTLVKRGFLAQSRMLAMNALLMAASTIAAVPVLLRVRPDWAALSLLLNFARRHHDVSNTVLVLGFALATASIL